jgi:hypothetical protein
MWLTVILLSRDTMNAGLAHTIDSLFGPASEKVDVNAFIESEKILYQDTQSNQSSSIIEEECRFYYFLFARALSHIDKCQQRFRHSRFFI